MEVSQDHVIEETPVMLNQLLQTGLLEHLKVTHKISPKFPDRPPLLHGVIIGPNILCSCESCNGVNVVTPNEFELHANSRNKHPADNIYLENGKTFRHILSACEGVPLDELEKTIKDAIGSCSRQQIDDANKFTYSDKALRLLSRKNKKGDSSSSTRRPKQATTPKVVRVKRTRACEDDEESDDFGGCILCRRRHFNKARFDEHTIILCSQCEREFHIGCLRKHNVVDLKEEPKGDWLCSGECESIHARLLGQVAEDEQELPENILNVIKTKEGEMIRWRLMSGKMAHGENKELLSKATAIFHERFDRIRDPNAKNRDLISDMVNGTEQDEVQFGGMYTALLMVNSSVVCAGLIRIFGQEIAELPLVATRTNSEKQGYFQTLFACIENLVRSLGVRNLLIPAAKDVKSFWTKNFGFNEMTPEQIKTYMRDYRLMIFKGTSMLQRPVDNEVISVTNE